jgi:ATP-binding cassette subfamily B protein
MGLGGGALHTVWQQRRTLRYLEEGGRPSWRTVGRLWQVLRRHAGKLALALALTGLGVVVGLVPPLLMREIIDRAIPRHQVGSLLWLGGGLLLFPAAGAVVSMGQNYLNAVVGQGVIHDLRTRMYRHGQELGLGFFTHTPAGEIHSRLVNDLNAIQMVLTQVLSGLFVNVLTVALTLATMFSLNWQLALLSALVLPTFALPVMSLGKQSYGAITATQEALSRLTAHLEETLSLSGVLVVRTFGTRAREADRFHRLSDGVRVAAVRQSMVGQGLSVAVQILSALGPALLYGYGGYLVMTGKVQLGTVVAFATYLVRLYQPASSLAGSNTVLLGGLALFDRVFRFLDLPVDVPEPAHPQPVPTASGSSLGLVFRDVHFAYPASATGGKGPEVLHGVSFEARGGELTALVGPSGAGKSTILSLAARLYDPDAGEVRLGGVPLPQVADQELRRLVAVVTQDLYLFHTTLRDNVRYGRPEATEEEVWQAVEAAQLVELVDRLPQGLDTVVGERGHRLSGGEKQRVAIARAILTDPRVLLLDEATSSLDSHSERLLQEALAHLFQGRTVVAIAHRLSTILAADQILVIREGQVVERGRHDELLGMGGLYARLYHEQFDPLARRVAWSRAGAVPPPREAST